MAKEFDTSWFDLKNYEPFKKMSIEEWASVIQTRIFINESYEGAAEEKALGEEESYGHTQEDLQKMASHLKYKCHCLFDRFDYFTVDGCSKGLLSNYSFSTPTVNSLTVIEAWEISVDLDFGIHIEKDGGIYKKYRGNHLIQTLMTENMLHKMAEAEKAANLAKKAYNKAKAEPTAESVWEYQKALEECKKAADGQSKALEEYKKEFDGDENYKDFIREDRTPHDFRHRQYFNRDNISTKAHVTIDLASNNEQIKNDFSHWLMHYRKESGCHVPKKKIHEKRFNQKTFDYWIEYGLFPYLDLTLIAKIEGKEITQEKLGELIFPNEIGDVDTTWRIGHITKPEAERLMNESTQWSILEQAAEDKKKTRGMKKTK